MLAPTDAKPVELGLDFEIRALPEKVGVFVGDVKKVMNPRSGKEMLAMTDMAVPVSMTESDDGLVTRNIIEEGLAASACSRLQPGYWTAI